MNEKGLYRKYEVVEHKTGQIVNNCFVLEPLADKAARIALDVYAEITNNRLLAKDLRNWMDKIRSDTFKELEPK